MAIAERELKQPKVLTYDDYLREGETPGRYEILDGVRHWMTSTHDFHQDIVQNILYAFKEYQKSAKSARAYVAAVDIITRFAPLKVRQPDVLLISVERYGDRQPMDQTPWPTAPELVVEVLSRSESKRQIATKLAEYSSVNVVEAWLINPESRKIEQWRLSPNNAPQLSNTLIEGQTLTSTAFPELEIEVASIFEY